MDFIKFISAVYDICCDFFSSVYRFLNFTFYIAVQLGYYLCYVLAYIFYSFEVIAWALKDVFVFIYTNSQNFEWGMPFVDFEGNEPMQNIITGFVYVFNFFKLLASKLYLIFVALPVVVFLSYETSEEGLLLFVISSLAYFSYPSIISFVKSSFESKISAIKFSFSSLIDVKTQNENFVTENLQFLTSVLELLENSSKQITVSIFFDSADLINTFENTLNRVSVSQISTAIDLEAQISLQASIFSLDETYTNLANSILND